MDDKHDWVKVAQSIEEISFGSNNISELNINGKTICLAQWDKVLFAFAHKCPHASGPFVQGFIDAVGNVVCPLHRYKFCLKNGRNVSGEGYYLKHWPVEVQQEGIYVGFPKNTLFGLL